MVAMVNMEARVGVGKENANAEIMTTAESMS